MATDTAKLTIRLPRDHIEFAKEYARAHDLSVTEVIDRFLRRMRALERDLPGSGLEPIRGLVPAEVDAVEEFRRYTGQKHHR